MRIDNIDHEMIEWMRLDIHPDFPVLHYFPKHRIAETLYEWTTTDLRKASVWWTVYLHEFTSMGGLTMPKRPDTPFAEVSFVNVRISADEKPAFDSWAEKQAKRVWEMIQSLADSGYKLSISPDLENSCYIATLTGTKYAVRNKNKAISSRSDDVIEAILLSAYKHVELFGEGEWEGEQRQNNWG